MARSYRLEDRLAKGAEKERKALEDLREAQNAYKETQRELQRKNRMTAGRILQRDGFLDLPPEEFNAGLHLWGVIRELGLLSKPSEAERRLREPTGLSVARSEDKVDLDILVGESVAALASAAE